MMKINTLFLFLFLTFGAAQLQGQIWDWPPLFKYCTSLSNVQQTCNEDGTVTITFRVNNNSPNTVNVITVSDGADWITSYNTNLWPYSTSSTLITYTGATPGTEQCFWLYLYDNLGNCCHRKVCVNVIENCCEEFKATVYDEIASDPCESNGGAVIHLSGYAPPIVAGGYTNTTGPGGGSAFPNANGTVNISGLAPGLYTYSFTDSNGCVVTGSFEVPGDEGVDCDFFDGIQANQDDEDSDENWCSPVYTSTVATTITVSFIGFTMPDQVTVFVNNVPTSMIAGDHYCVYDGPIEEWEEDEGATPDEVEFDVEIGACQTVQFCVNGDVCNLSGTYDPYYPENWDETAWILDVSCGGDIIGNRSFSSESNLAKSRARERTGAGSLRSENANTRLGKAIEIFPNPVSDILNITNYDSKVNYTMVRVLDTSGRTLITENMSNMTNLQLNASGLPMGAYFIEITADSGQRVVEKFVKVN